MKKSREKIITTRYGIKLFDKLSRDRKACFSMIRKVRLDIDFLTPNRCFNDYFVLVKTSASIQVSHL